jgi:hypothetical protein
VPCWKSSRRSRPYFWFSNVGKSSRRHALMSWKSYYNLLNKRKGIL